ncbi:E3 ubiquitin-protein ligase RNF14-like isoform X2 [Syngnathoides biaculeatus]|uniref:E3 ubiquitin-protein ligase RNF14-like isoform X2 n=1 Tax=Syngnathoides biaculeatus TaxID=300417 RepID=UPI002ADE1DA5|nr:E3 ubiquitin-protein ligase RNF14-like isoform X2 [Syngnathoides biaculeatus]
MDLEEQENELLALHSIFGSEDFVRHESKSAGEIRVSVELPSGYLLSLTDGEALKHWLTHKQLAALGAHLTDLYQAAGDVVLFSWIQFLREDTITFLNINSGMELSNEPSTPYNSQETKDVAFSEQKSQNTRTSGSKDDVSFFLVNEWTDSSNVDTRECATADPCKMDRINITSSCADDKTCGKGAGDKTRDTSDENRPFSRPTLTPAQTLLSEILSHDAVQGQKVFQSTIYNCAVCFMSYLGSECVQIPECGHVFCRACLAEFCKVQITEGNVRGVTCAQAGCTALPTQAQVKSLVGEELFRRYDHLLLQSTLDCMADVMYCPRPSCASPVVLEEGSCLALCSVCGFAFCVTCKKTYHGTNRCRPIGLTKTQRKNDPEQGNAHLPRSLVGMKALWDDYASGSEQRKRLLESRYGQNGLFLTLEGCLSEHWIAFNSKNCPWCFCRIQKNEGCNIMTCSQCRQLFCWACLTRLPHGTVYQHFQDSACSRY